MDNQDRMDLKRCRNVLIQSNDPRFNYAFNQEKDIQNFEKLPEIISLTAYDYGVMKDDGDDTKLPSLTPLSLLASTQSLEDMEEWYRQKYPKLPDEFHGIMARYSTGQTLTKKETKNAIKKYNKKSKNKGQDPPVGMTMVKGKFSLSFD